MAVDADAARLATVAGLREKLARLGGLAGSRPAAVGGGVREHGGSPLPRQPGAASEPRGQGTASVPRQPGFFGQPTLAGTAWVRRVDVDLRPLLDAAGAPDAASAQQLLSLVGRSEPGGAGGMGGAGAAVGAPIAVLDIESLGLRGSGVMAFLVGVGLQRGTRMELHQLLLADPGEEPALLLALLELLDGCALLVTYNGRTFDVPVLRGRCIVNRLDGTPLDAPPHCDLLGPVRRLFRDRLGPCTLRQAEVDLLAMERVDDVPGFEAPARYRTWLRGGGAEVLAGVVRHNQLDVIATAVLGARLAAHVAGHMVQPVHAADRFRLALHLERHARHEAAEQGRAERLLRDTVARRAAPWDRRAAHRLAHRLRRSGGDGADEALRLLRSLWREEPADLRAARALAVALERAQLVEEALDVASRTLKLCAAMPAWRRGALRGAPAGGWCADWERRVERLEQRLARRSSGRDRAARRAVSPAAERQPALLEVSCA